MIPRRLWVVALVLVASCQEDCRCNCRASDGPVMVVPGERLSIRAKGRDTIELEITRAQLRVGHVAIRAAGPRSAWVYALAIDDAIRDEGDQLTLPQGGRCVLRYLDSGRATEADYTISRARVRPLSRGSTRLRVQLDLRCRKRFSVTSAGTPHAPSLPDELEILGIVTLMQRD